MNIKLYNTKTGKKEELKPVTEGKVTMYVCGPTVYSYPHIGNARGPVLFDVLANLIRINHELTYVRNITDLDDKIYKQRMKRDVIFQRLLRNTQKFIIRI